MGRPKVVILPDYPEEGFPSMDVYFENLFKNLKSLHKGFHLVKYLGLSGVSQNLGYHSLKTRFIFRYLINPICCLFHQGDVNHILDQTNGHLLYFLNAEKTVITVHDLDVLRLKFLKWTDLRSKIIRWAYLLSVNAIKRANRVIAVSVDTKNDLIRYLQIDPEKITVIPEGAEPIYRRITSRRLLDVVKNKYHLPEKFILHVGQTWDYKNLEGILKVFSLLKQQPRNHDLFFVKVGADWTPKQLRLIRKLSLEKYIIKLPFIKKSDLPSIYSLAQCLVQLSFLEGFGLTVLEAMSCGCPVIVSDTPALAALVGKAGLINFPRVYTSAADQINTLIHNRRQWQKYSLLGQMRSRQYSWQACARESLRVYESIIN